MYDLKDIQVAKARTSGRDKENLEKSNSLILEALDDFERYQNNLLLTDLRAAADKLTEAIKFNRTNGKAYFLLSYTFYFLNNYQLAFKYLRFAEEMEPNLPEVKVFKELLGGNVPTTNYQQEQKSSIPQKQESLQKQISALNPPPVVINKAAKSFLNKIKFF